MFSYIFLLGHKILVTELMARLCTCMYTHTHTHIHTHTHTIFTLADTVHMTIFYLFQYILKSHSILRTSVTDVLQYWQWLATGTINV